MTEIMLACIFFGVFIIYSFLKGIQIGQKISKDEKIEIKSPIKMANEYKESKEIKEEIKRIQEIDEINLQNIENYDGSSTGQLDFPNERR